MFRLIYFARTSSTNFYQNLPKIIFTSTSIGKCHKCLETNVVHFVLPQFYPIKTMSQSPCFDIEYWRSYGLFHLSGAKYKILHRIVVTFLIFNIIIFHLNGFKPHHLPFIPTIHMLVSINKSLSNLLLKSTIVVVTFFWKFFFDTVVINILPATFKNLKKTAFFSCVLTYAGTMLAHICFLVVIHLLRICIWHIAGSIIMCQLLTVCLKMTSKRSIRCFICW